MLKTSLLKHNLSETHNKNVLKSDPSDKLANDIIDKIIEKKREKAIIRIKSDIDFNPKDKDENGRKMIELLSMLVETINITNKKLDTLVESQSKSDSKLNALVEINAQMLEIMELDAEEVDEIDEELEQSLPSSAAVQQQIEASQIPQAKLDESKT
jgi:hypothetical protein